MSKELKAWFTVDELNAWAEKKLKENPQWAEQPAQQDIPDLIAGTMGVSRGTAYDLMREALAKAHPQQERPSFVEWTTDYVQDNLHKLKPAPVQQEPVGWITQARCLVDAREFTEAEAKLYGWTPLYTSPQPAQQEPVAYIEHHKAGDNLVWDNPGANSSPLYTSPPAQRTWQGLTDEEIEQCMKQAYATVQGRQLEHAFARAIEAKLRSKNEDRN